MACPFRTEERCTRTGYTNLGVCCIDDYERCKYIHDSEIRDIRYMMEQREKARRQGSGTGKTAARRSVVNTNAASDPVSNAILGIVIAAVLIGVLFVLARFAFFFFRDSLAERGVLKSQLSYELSSDTPDIRFSDYSLRLVSLNDKGGLDVKKVNFSKNGTAKTSLKRGEYSIALVKNKEWQCIMSNEWIDGYGKVQNGANVDALQICVAVLTFTDKNGKQINSDRVSCTVDGVNSYAFEPLSDGTALLLISGPSTDVKLVFSSDGQESEVIPANFNQSTYLNIQVVLKGASK